MATEKLIVEDEYTVADLLPYRRYRIEAEGYVEAMLDANPGLADDGIFLALGREIVTDIPAKRDAPADTVRVIRLWD
ncbi:MAG: phage tail protein [Chelatococcus sp.]|nr:MAG: phage tail protein [Chelatococcus sp.]